MLPSTWTMLSTPIPMASNSLPVELWCQILQESISAPSLLNPYHLSEATNPLLGYSSSCSWQPEQSYWSTERHRNILRRVCKSWDAYLCRFNHRFVRASDVYHRHVPKEALLNATRIEQVPCKSTDCPMCTLEGDEQQLLALIARLGQSSVEIIKWHTYEVSCEILALLWKMSSMLPSLKVIMTGSAYSSAVDIIWPGVITVYPKLSSIMFSTDMALSDWPIISAPNLTMLDFFHPSRPFMIPLEKFHLPSLRHLRFSSHASQIGEQSNRLIPLLKAVGRNLLSLQVGTGTGSWEALPPEVWELCPLLERLDTTLCYRHPPHPSHPIHTISAVFRFAIVQNEEVKRFSRLPTSLNNWPSLRRIIIKDIWDQLPYSWTPEEIRSFLLTYISYCEENGISVQDQKGILLKESGLESFLIEWSILCRMTDIY